MVNAQVSTARLETREVMTPEYVPGTEAALNALCHKKLIPYSHGLHKRAQIQASEYIGAAQSAKAR